MMSTIPWVDWIPGVLSKTQVAQLCAEGYIDLKDNRQIGQSSIDLTLSNECYELTEGSIKPFGARYLTRIGGLYKPVNPDSSGKFLLEPRRTYLFKARERLHLRETRSPSPIHGQATAKSSIGRLDVLARLIVDGMDSYEEFHPDGVREGTGDMFLEVTPITFRVCVKEGVALSQLRLFCGKPGDAEVRGENVYRTLLRASESADAKNQTSDGTLSVDLTPIKIGEQDVAAFRADGKDGHEPIQLWAGAPRANPCTYWKFETADQNRRLRIAPSKFYILRSKEKIAVPRGIAVYCRAIDETIGEIRIHYAGFVHPYFGRDENESRLDTPLIFEVRGHDIPVSLRDGEKLARLAFYRMSMDAEYDSSDPAEYNRQTLKLSKFFEDWPKELGINNSTRSVWPTAPSPPEPVAVEG